jgi:uncharacterized protein YndB with AHSA1/START domain
MGNDSIETPQRVTVKVTRRFRVSPERVFDAWLDPNRAREFLFTRPGQLVVHAEINAKVGGSFLFVVRREHNEIDHTGTYLEIQRPNRLVFTLCVPTAWSGDNRVQVDIVPLESGCELTVTHEAVIPHHESRIESGWTFFLQELEAKVDSLPEHRERPRPVQK